MRIHIHASSGKISFVIATTEGLVWLLLSVGFILRALKDLEKDEGESKL